MSFTDEIDHDEHDAVRGEVEREARDEFMDELEEKLVDLVRFAREVPSGNSYDQVAAIARRVEAQRLNVGTLAMLVGLAMLGLGQPASAPAVVHRLAKHLYDQTYNSTSSPATDDDDFRVFVVQRWDDEKVQADFRKRAEDLLLVAFAV